MESLNLSTFLVFNRILRFHLIKSSWDSPIFRLRLIYITLKNIKDYGYEKEENVGTSKQFILQMI